LRLKSLRMSGFRALADARFAKAAIAFTVEGDVEFFISMWASWPSPMRLIWFLLREGPCLHQLRSSNE